MATQKKSSTPDDKITQLLAKVEAQKAAIAEAERPVFRTNRTFSFVDGDLNKSHNLAVVSDVSALLKMMAHVAAAAQAYYGIAGDILGPDEKPPAFTWNGYSDLDWLHDIKLRVSQIRLKAAREKLQDLEARLDKIISPERRRELELQAIERELSK
jgi:hypothetical protein